MILQLFRRTPRNDSIAPLYGAIVAQARAPSFYRTYGVPDTVNGRFEMIVLHMVLLLARLQTEPPRTRDLGQAVFDQFCQDMDASMREMGVGDLSVPKKMRSVGEAFYGRKAAYTAAIAAPGAEEALAAALAQNVYEADSATVTGANRLAAYVREAAQRLTRRSGEDLSRAELDFPDPESIVQKS